jgi:hypothetical protein
MYELLWFVGGALTYQLLAKMLKVTQIYMFFQEIHVHMLMMLDAASQDIEAAIDLKKQLIQDSMIGEEEVKLINLADERAIEAWRLSAILKIQSFIPGTFKDAVQYNNWDELKKYLNSIMKK